MVQKMPGKPLASRRQAAGEAAIQNQEAAVGAGPPAVETEDQRTRAQARCDLNLAMDGLREVMPYAHTGPRCANSPRSPLSYWPETTSSLLTSSLEEMKRLVGEIYGGHHSAFHCGTVGHSAGHPARTPPTPCTRRIPSWAARSPLATPRPLCPLPRCPPSAPSGLPTRCSRRRHASGAAAGQRLPALGQAALPLHHLPDAAAAAPVSLCPPPTWPGCLPSQGLAQVSSRPAGCGG